MKPIELKLAGLQSYREEQRIDFSELCDTGIFGIFGPTGSGKSSILDAMTLALYGKVERALNGTQGIMNQAESTLSVSLSFALTGAAGTRQFRVERRFKRTGEVTISNTVCRFIEISAEGEQVIADKLADVNRSVEEHIGLKMDDFTRAVVLPQGKFSEFLSLKGSERRQMLQRLFSLEKYGDELGVKLARRVKEADADVKTCVAEQQGLGDASPEAVTAAEQALADAIALAEQAREAKLTAEREYRAMAERRGWQIERDEVTSRLRKLDADAPRIAEQEELVRQAAAAEVLMPVIAEANESEALQQGAQVKLTQAEEAYRVASVKAEEASCISIDARREREQQEPELLRKQEQLQEALNIAEEAKRLEQEAAECEQRLHEAHASYTAAKAEVERAQALLARASERQAELKTLLKQNERPIAERERFQEAWQLKQQFDAEAVRYQELAALQQASEAAHVEQQRNGDVAFQSVLAKVDAISVCTDRGQSLGPSVVTLQNRAVTVVEYTENAIKAIREQVWVQQKQVLAAQLAAELQVGDNCPVCGSTEHPHRAHAHTGAQSPVESDQLERKTEQLAATEAQLKAWEQLRDEARAFIVETHNASSRSQSIVAQWKERISNLKERLQHSLGLQEQAIDAPYRLSGSDEQDNNAAYFNQIASALSIDLTVDSFANSTTSSTVASPKTVENSNAVVDTNTVMDRATFAAATVFASASASVPNKEQSKRAADADPSELVTWCTHETEQLRVALADYLSEQESCTRQMETEYSQFADTLWQLQRSRDNTDSSAKALREANKALESAENKRQTNLNAWQQSFADWRFEELESLREQWREWDATAQDCRSRLERSVAYLDETQAQLKQHEQVMQVAERNQVQAEAELSGIKRLLSNYEPRLRPWAGGQPLTQLVHDNEACITALRARAETSTVGAESARKAEAQSEQQAALARQTWTAASERAHAAMERLAAELTASPFRTPQAVQAAALTSDERQRIQAALAMHHEAQRDLAAQLRRLDERLVGQEVSDEAWSACEECWKHSVEQDEATLATRAKAERDAEELTNKHARWAELEHKRQIGAEHLARLQQLQSVFRGNAFVEFVAEEQLLQVSRAASERLKKLTKQRYALEVDSGGGFVIRDDANGGIRRPVSTLSGGETFLTSLALALALSAQIQLRGMYPLEFFFLDEGFGTLDPELLDTVVTALEKLHSDRLAVGVISHVPELRARLPRKLCVIAAEQAGRGSRIVQEFS
ncbi:AAA family ATPase [Paenibacillus sp. 481]|uniref:AAA family ATPase n=1 Tax=Paenibacillus sp. 481 TaxID=2835869 RepID=UPI001E28D690|nr:SMC family ATPase [Paenibacillus sp. 481]UHA74178.1 SMC family ATPase [Paenibacillus sp. 481]